MNPEINSIAPARTDQQGRIAPGALNADRPILTVSTDGVVKTPSDNSLADLFTQDAAAEFRHRWDAVQRGFVDGPQEAVHSADELVAQVIQSLTDSFAKQREALDGEIGHTEKASTENLRLALRRYRSFFERLLSI
jgi:hypothetical protein